jgi:hypothetical protein
MFQCFTVRGAYGRNYKSQRAIKADFLAGKDFQLVDSGQYINLEDCKRGGIPSLNVRYSNDKKAFQVLTKWALELYATINGGWYFADSSNKKTSVTYSSKAEALEALQADSITWQGY